MHATGCKRLPRLLIGAWVAVAPFAGTAPAQAHRAERFDTSGMPRRATNFVEQQILEMIASHPRGDLSDAARIQRKLGRYYADRGDQERANAAFLAAAEAEQEGDNRPVAAESHTDGPPAPAPPPPSSAARGTPPAGGPAAEFSGNYYGYEGRTLHTWDFYADGTFLHTWIVSGAGTGVRNSERGRFRLSGGVMELRIGSSASGFVTPGVGGRTTIVGGGSEAGGEVRRMKFGKTGDGILLDGVALKPKSW